MDIRKSIAFLETKGTELEKARLQCILHGSHPSPELCQGLFELQNTDGGFPFAMHRSNLSTLNETTVALWWLEELDLLTSPAADQALDYLIRTQRPDGSWDEDPGLAQYELPPWIQLGDPRTQLYLSAYAAYWLAVGGRTSLPAFRKALHFLIRHQDETGKFYGYLHTSWIATGVFMLSGKRYREMANLGLQALSNRALSEWADSQIAWALDCLSQGGLPQSDPFVKKCLDELLIRQNPDGSWASEDGEASAVGATLQVIKVLKRYGLVTVGLED